MTRRSAALVCLILSFLPSAQAGESLSVLRDAEIEGTIRLLADPLFRAVNIPPSNVTIRILNNRSLNAFVPSSRYIVLHSGLLEEVATPEQLIGVIAHEVGHIAGGHVARLQGELKKAQMSMLVAQALGIIAGAVSGRIDAGLAAATLGSHVAQRSLFAFSRAQEASADAFAMKALGAAGYSAQGLSDFFRILEGQEYLAAANQDPYARTHPLSRDRIVTIERHVQKQSLPTALTEGAIHRHERMRAKLFAFLRPLPQTLIRYPEHDVSWVARYARSIAYFRQGDLARALPLIDQLISENSTDPYLHELRGQMLVEQGRVADGLPSYQRAAELLPKSPLIATSYGHALLEHGTPVSLEKAISALQKAVLYEPGNSMAWKFLGTALGRTGETGKAAYALAEYKLLIGNPQQALFHVEKALKLLRKRSPLRLRAQDIKAQAQAQLASRK